MLQIKPSYIVQRWPHGWLVCASELGVGIPVTAISELLPLLKKGAVIHSGISHHFNALGDSSVIACLGSIDELKLWEEEIKERITNYQPEQRWWAGLDVGLSSATIFAVLAKDSNVQRQAAAYSNGAVPHDADDLSRCLQLIEEFPTWKEELHKVATAHPNTKWPKIIAKWDELKNASKTMQGKLLQEI